MANSKPEAHGRPAREGLPAENTQFNCRLPVDLKTQLDELAAKQDRSLASVVVAAIEWYIQNVSEYAAELDALRRVVVGGQPHLRAILRDVVELEAAYVWLEPKRVAVAKAGE